MKPAAFLLATTLALTGCAPIAVTPPPAPVGPAGQPAGEPGTGTAPSPPDAPAPDGSSSTPPTRPPSTGGSGGSGGTPDNPRLTVTVSAQAVGTWATAAPLRVPRLGAGAAALGDTLVVAEGAMYLSDERFDGTAWNLDIPDQDGSGKYMSAGARDGARLVLVGGHYWSTSAIITAFGPEGRLAYRRAMVDTSTMTDASRRSPAIAAFDGTLVVAGGEDEQGRIVASTLRIALESEAPDPSDPDAIAATPMAPMPHPVAGAAYASLDDALYVFGGYTRSETEAIATATTQVYDLGDDAWRTDVLPPLPAPRHGGAAAVLDGRLYFAGGLDASGRPTGEVWRWAPGEAAWTLVTHLPTPRAYLALVAWEGKLWAIGGTAAQGPSTTVEVYRP